MTDNFTRTAGLPKHAAGAAGPDAGHPFRGQLVAHGIPEEMHGRFAAHGVGTLVEKLGIVFREITVERVVATMPVEGNQQVAGILHGGASAALAETLGSVAAAAYGGEDRRPVGVDLNVTHHRPGLSGLVTGTCMPIHLGRTLTTHEIVITGEDGRRVCTARITNMLLDS
ncbi:thioesterase [Zafaria cholistanensis]|uniref:Thioesterase n=1 Tax=Zafaria cholistanensis TaxID=1682741 RepID=A0A5A7NS23_9MICC|nr:hotdog fold thioesterase [Zafaria cholistanensis]GER23436.1 thioesterase [Zafaria cholistanensis]